MKPLRLACLSLTLRLTVGLSPRAGLSWEMNASRTGTVAQLAEYFTNLRSDGETSEIQALKVIMSLLSVGKRISSCDWRPDLCAGHTCQV